MNWAENIKKLSIRCDEIDTKKQNAEMRQIILDLKGKLASDNSNDKKDFTELSETLKSLGYKMPDIKRILPQINSELSLENQIKEALKLLLK